MDTHTKFGYVHCWIMQGWALWVLKKIIQNDIKNNPSLQPDAIRIFTLISDRKSINIDNKNIQIVWALPQWIENIFLRSYNKKPPVLRLFFDYRNLFFFYPLCLKVLSNKIRNRHTTQLTISSFAIAKNIDEDLTKNAVLYIHSPMQYIRTHSIEYQQKMQSWKKIIFNSIRWYIKKRDLLPRTYKHIIANSEYTKQQVDKIYWVQVDNISYPPIHQSFINQPFAQPQDVSDYYIFVWRISYLIKEVDITIRLFNKIGKKLYIVGDWPDLEKAKKIAWPTITFFPRTNTVWDLVDLVRLSRWFVNLTHESFGMVTIEALCLWVPVFGYDYGWSKELVWPDSWILVPNKKQATLITYFETFTKTQRNRDISKNTAVQLLQDHMMK